MDLSKHRAAIQSDCDSLPDICNTDIHKTVFSAKTYTVLNNELLMVCKERAEALVKTSIR